MARPNEIKAVSALLMDPHDDITELAKAIIRAVDESRQDRTDFLVCRRWGGLVDAFGPYPTDNAARKAIETNKVPGIDGTRFYVVPLYNPKRADDTWEKVDASAISPEAQKVWEIARNGGQAARTHGRSNRKRG